MKISYNKRWSNEDGACYSQAVSITRDELNKFLDILRQEIKKPKITKKWDYLVPMHLKNPVEFSRNGKVAFINLTQRDLFLAIFNVSRLIFKDRNTCLLLK